jgi:hypothetical protein
MTRLIDADALLERLSKYDTDNIMIEKDVFYLINNTPTIEASGEAVDCNVEGSWLWCKLMDYCKARKIAPATENELFKIAGEAHKLYTSPQKGEWNELNDEQIEIIALDNKYWFGFDKDRFDWLQYTKDLQAKLKEVNHG